MSLKIGKLQLFLTGPLIVVGFLSVILVSVLAFNQSRSVLQRMGGDVALESVDFVSEFLQEIDGSVSRTIHYGIPEYIRLLDDIKGAERKYLVKFLYLTLKEQKYVRSLYIAYSSGGVIGVGYDFKSHSYYAFYTDSYKPGKLKRYKLSASGEMATLIDQDSNFDFRERPWSDTFASKKAGWSPLYKGFYDDQLTITKSQPIFDSKRNIKYVVAADIFLDKIDDYLSKLMQTKDTVSLVTDSKGLIITTSNRITARQVQGLEIESAFNDPQCIIRCTIRNAQDKYGGLGNISDTVNFSSPNESGNVSVGIQALNLSDDFKIYIFNMVPDENYAEYLSFTARVIILVGSIITLLLLFLGYFVRIYISNPISILNEKVKKIGEGKWTEQISLNRNDEIGELADSFNFMSKRLRSTLLNLESLVDERAEDLKDLILKYSTSIEDLEHANATKDRFFSIIAHDLKSPFNALKGYSAVIEDSYDSLSSDQLRVMINKIAVSSEEAHGLLENLLQWAMVQKGGLRVKWQNINAYEIVSEVYELMKVNAKVKNIGLVNNLDKSVWIYADLNMVSTVIRNIVSNSIKFTPTEGRISVDGEIVGKRFEMRISDTGVGISKENIAKMFAKDVFYTRPGTSDEKGTGLGIGLSKEFVVMNEGTIHVESVVGKGTTFIVSWKVAEQANLLESKVSNRKVKILIIDDSEDNHNLLNIYLKGQSFEISNALSGRNALDLFEDSSYDIVLLDLNMPDMNGFETCKKIRKIEKENNYKQSHIICFTSSILQSDIDTAIQVGFDSFVVKPIKKQKLINTINRLIGEK